MGNGCAQWAARFIVSGFRKISICFRKLLVVNSNVSKLNEDFRSREYVMTRDADSMKLKDRNRRSDVEK